MFRVVIPLLPLVLLWAGPASAGKTWKQILKKDGVTISEREEPGRGFPTFRGVGEINASIYQILGVMSDTRRLWEWMDRCADARQLRKVSELEYIVYMRTDVPWPIWDRDAVYHTTVHVDTKRYRVDIRFRAVKHRKMPPVKGVVRMTDLRGHYRLQALAPTKTRVEIMVDADPKGSLPKWLAKVATRRLPLYTIRGLRKQAKKTRGWYDKRIERWKSGKY
jgi:hypothetical protein